jgi:hypothetical protein
VLPRLRFERAIPGDDLGLGEDLKQPSRETTQAAPNPQTHLHHVGTRQNYHPILAAVFMFVSVRHDSRPAAPVVEDQHLFAVVKGLPLLGDRQMQWVGSAFRQSESPLNGFKHHREEAASLLQCTYRPLPTQLAAQILPVDTGDHLLVCVLLRLIDNLRDRALIALV